METNMENTTDMTGVDSEYIFLFSSAMMTLALSDAFEIIQ
jgi:hypothetical protein